MDELKQMFIVGGFVGLIAFQVGMHFLTAAVKAAQASA